MPIFSASPPLSLYIHMPWCIQKCPYCDFNSHALRNNMPETDYVKALIANLEEWSALIQGRPLVSIFLGGGTPNLFSPTSIATILDAAAKQIEFSPDIEITLEANPGAVHPNTYKAFLSAGINRLSLGVQSMQDAKLKMLGRIHQSKEVCETLKAIISARFDNFNVDIMHGLPQQTVEDALYDLQTVLKYDPPHLSWYQLTLEPNTLFYQKPPVLPADEVLWQIQQSGHELIQQKRSQYEVSAYAIGNQFCRHNKNYWQFGDYIGLGAGAHSKITDIKQGKVMRFSQVKHPRDFLTPTKRRQVMLSEVTLADLIFEFMLNALRLTEGVKTSLFTERTGLDLSMIQPKLDLARQKGLLTEDKHKICASPLGLRFLNDLQLLFLS